MLFGILFQGAISFTTDKMRTNINLYLMVRIGENTNLGGIYSTETAELTIQPGFLNSSLTDPNHDSVTLKNMVSLNIKQHLLFICVLYYLEAQNL